jgi:hypothetical protein
MTFVPSDHEHAAKVAATPARQGRWGRHVLWVLVVSFVLAGAAMAIVWAFHAKDLQRADNSSSPTISDTQKIDTTSAARPGTPTQ